MREALLAAKGNLIARMSELELQVMNYQAQIEQIENLLKYLDKNPKMESALGDHNTEYLRSLVQNAPTF